MDEAQSIISHTDAQRHHVMPPTPELSFQPNAPVPTQDTDAIIPNCSCQRCSDAQRRQPTWYHIEDRDMQPFGNGVAPYVNQDQGIENHVETALAAPVRLGTQFVPAQPEAIQDNFGYAPVHERAGPSNMGLVQASTLDMSMVEGRRRLAARYVDNVDAYVSMIRLEPSPSGRFQVIITLEMTTL